MKFLKYSCLFLFAGIFLNSCFTDNDDVFNNASVQEINEFIWRGMNTFYLYKADVPDLANDRFSSSQERANFLSNFSTPEIAFDALLSKEIDQASGLKVDEFSFLVDDYIELEQSLDGITKNNGMEYGLARYPNHASNVFGYVRYVLPNTDAAAKGIKRGDIFSTIDGTQITDSNFRELLAPDTYAIGLADFDGNTVTPTDTSITLTKVQYTENPVFLCKTLDVGGNPVGYLMYNGFTANFDTQLNDAFGKFVTDGITDLVLDLRYNGGGSVISAIDLSSMITGQFNGQVFSTEEWNADRQDQFGDTNLFDNEIRTGANINSVNLTKVYVLTTGSSASASELVINGLDPYIDVIQVGVNTSGKFQASITLYDSSNFGRTGVNTGHTYAIQPLVLRSLNADGVTDYFGGFTPEIEVSEDFSNLGVLGDPNETLLKAAIDDILNGKKSRKQNFRGLEIVGNSNMFDPTYERMYKEPTTKE
ncbi:peptidase S41 [Flavobacteriaceae bacterium (ex Bugula neritina AB1)]|nr:peptidase S41 [Flavobacteriaceae bacterium (ex Bugula neritina AB1)]